MGWKEFTPFDKIIITAVASEMPPCLIEQLKVGGKMILPLETSPNEQYLVLVSKSERNEIEQKKLLPVRFVPLQ